MNTNMINRCRVLRPLVLAALLTFAAIANIASTTMAAPTDPPPSPTCVVDCKASLGILGVLPILSNVLCANFCDNDTAIQCENDCKNNGVISIPVLTCNQFCFDVL